MRTNNSIPHPRVCPQQSRTLAAQRLQTVFVHADPPRQAVLLTVLFWAALRIASIAAACRHLVNGPCDQTVRTLLLNSLPKHRRTLERRCHQALIQDLPRSLR